MFPLFTLYWYAYGISNEIFSLIKFQEAADAAQSAMVSVIGLDSEKVQQLCDAANQEVDEADKVQIANYLCPVSTRPLYFLF